MVLRSKKKIVWECKHFGKCVSFILFLFICLTWPVMWQPRPLQVMQHWCQKENDSPPSILSHAHQSHTSQCQASPCRSHLAAPDPQTAHKSKLWLNWADKTDWQISWWVGKRATRYMQCLNESKLSSPTWPALLYNDYWDYSFFFFMKSKTIYYI